MDAARRRLPTIQLSRYLLSCYLLTKYVDYERRCGGGQV
jgi:hypothetical protein